MATIVTENARIQVPDSQNIIVKVSGWVKYKKGGEIHHIAPRMVRRIEENDPPTKEGIHGEKEHLDSNVIYQNPHGRV